MKLKPQNVTQHYYQYVVESSDSPEPVDMGYVCSSHQIPSDHLRRKLAEEIGVNVKKISVHPCMPKSDQDITFWL